MRPYLLLGLAAVLYVYYRQQKDGLYIDQAEKFANNLMNPMFPTPKGVVGVRG